MPSKPKPTHCPKCGHDLSEPLEPRDLFTPADAQALLDFVYVPKNPPAFEAFWSAYPRKVGKKHAVAAFAKLKLTGEEMDRLLAALEVQKASDQWNRQGVQYVPHPATWLNQRRWEDDPAAYGPGRSPRVGLAVAPGQKLSHDDTHLSEPEDVGGT